MNEAGMSLMSQASGTSRNPQSWPMPMMMKRAGTWHFMFMGTGFVVDTQQSGPRGNDKLFATNWFMTSAQHTLGRGAISFDLMTSLEPLTITQRRYPELFQTGETAYGVPLVDAQHPHDLIMALAVHYVRPIRDNTSLQIYFAPVGDPALGPVAFPHRASAAEIPQATLGHHWQDSTHVANEVITAGITHRWLTVEASGFHGAEPNENRWNIDHGAIDSWSGRIAALPARNWAAQVSVGRLQHPEAQEPGDVVRATASVSYVKPINGATWATSLIWGRNHHTISGRNSNSYLLETGFPLTQGNLVTGRIELVDKDELVPDRSFRIAAFTAGYTRDFGHIPYVQSGIGANLTAYRVPGELAALYGAHPVALNVFVRFRLRGSR
jgi:hypothetical protein